MKPLTRWFVLLGLMLLCIVTVAVCRCREMMVDWYEKRPPCLRDYLAKVIAAVLEFFD